MAMNILGNILWVIFGGFLLFLEYMLGGLLLCCTIIGIPFGLQVFQIGMLALFPFGQTAVVTDPTVGCLSALMNLIWILFGGIEIALTHLLLGIVFCCTIIGIPFGLQHFKLMGLALTPFGRSVVPA